MSGDFQDVCLSLTFLVMSSALHPQSQRAVEKAHQTLKTMIQTYSIQFCGMCDVALPFLLFAERDPVMNLQNSPTVNGQS